MRDYVWDYYTVNFITSYSGNQPCTLLAVSSCRWTCSKDLVSGSMVHWTCSITIEEHDKGACAWGRQLPCKHGDLVGHRHPRSWPKCCLQMYMQILIPPYSGNSPCALLALSVNRSGSMVYRTCSCRSLSALPDLYSFWCCWTHQIIPFSIRSDQMWVIT